MAIALIDANNFYASCEQMINPSIRGKPVIVLSNNDGCIISRSAEAKEFKIKMGEPYFKAKNKLDKINAIVCSSNYELYGDMSQRLMKILQKHSKNIEIYSIDEAFVEINRPKDYNLIRWAQNLRSIVYRDIGLPIAVGIGITKVQAKIANHLAKNTEIYAGICDINTHENIEKLLALIDIEDIWGIGKKVAYWCRLNGITNALQFRNMNTNKLKAKYGVVGIRLQEELKGNSCIELKEKNTPKKETCVSRSFSRAIKSKKELMQAIATYVARAALKLREQSQLARSITIFVRTNSYTKKKYSKSATINLDIPSNNTFILIRASLSLIDKIYEPNYNLVKAGVIMQELQSNSYIQQYMKLKNNPKVYKNQESLMKTIDHLNTRYGKDTITWCVCGMNKEWSMKRESLTKAATTKIEDIAIVKA